MRMSESTIWIPLCYLGGVLWYFIIFLVLIIVAVNTDAVYEDLKHYIRE